MMEATPERTVLKVEYSKAKLYRRFFAFFIDVFLLAFLTGITYGLANMGITRIPAYEETISQRTKLQLDSGLYNSDQQTVVDYVSTAEEFTTVELKKDYLARKLQGFYENAAFCTVKDKEGYDDRRINAKDAGIVFFEVVEGEIRERNINPQYFYDFYVKEVENHALLLLSQNSQYFQTTQVIFLTSFISIVTLLILNYGFLNVIVPVCIFRQGRKTFGRAVFRIGIVDRKALSPTRGKYILRAILEFLFFIVLDFVAFLLPLGVSATMLLLSEHSQNLTDYIFGHYMVDTTVDDVYEDPYHFQEKKNLNKKSLLEDPDFQIEQNHI